MLRLWAASIGSWFKANNGINVQGPAGGEKGFGNRVRESFSRFQIDSLCQNIHAILLSFKKLKFATREQPDLCFRPWGPKIREAVS